MIHLADPDTLSNPAKKGIDMEKQLARQEIRIATTANFETILTIQELQTPSDTFELKFETVFACAKDTEARRTEASFFVKQEVLHNIEMACSNFLETDVTELQKPAVQHESVIQTFHIWAKRIVSQYGKGVTTR